MKCKSCKSEMKYSKKLDCHLCINCIFPNTDKDKQQRINEWKETDVNSKENNNESKN